jgi:DNA-directed RNA polymerase specialized sigma24 family protein
MPSASDFPNHAAPHSFRTTRWSVIRRTGDVDDAVAMQALTVLCDTYWYPLYAYIRRSGKSAHDAEDLTQGFFARLVEKGVLASADPGKGKLRTFLLKCVQNFLADEWDRAMAGKRGAGVLPVTFDPERAEERYATEPVDDLTPDRLFQRRWALTILDQSLQLLGEEFAGQGRAEMFEALRPFLGFGPDPEECYGQIADKLGVPVGTLKNQVFRLRKRWRDLLFEQVAQTLDEPTPEDIKGELRELFACV